MPGYSNSGIMNSTKATWGYLANYYLLLGQIKDLLTRAKIALVHGKVVEWKISGGIQDTGSNPVLPKLLGKYSVCS